MDSVGFEQYDEELAQGRIAVIEQELAMVEASNEALQEAYSDAVRQMFSMEDIGWQALSGPQGSLGKNLPEAKRVAKQLSDWTVTNPLLGRGIEIRCSYLFGEPYEIGTEDAKTEITPQQRNIIFKPENLASVFSLPALATIEGQRYEAGTVFVQYNKTDKEFQVLEFDWIDDIIYDPHNPQRINYVKVSYVAEVVRKDGTVQHEAIKYWVPATTHRGTLHTRIGDTRFSRSSRWCRRDTWFSRSRGCC